MPDQNTSTQIKSRNETNRDQFMKTEGFDPDSTAALRLKANSLVENISAFRQAITLIEKLRCCPR
jgi:hypothetical protein